MVTAFWLISLLVSVASCSDISVPLGGCLQCSNLKVYSGLGDGDDESASVNENFYEIPSAGEYITSFPTVNDFSGCCTACNSHPDCTFWLQLMSARMNEITARLEPTFTCYLLNSAQQPVEDDISGNSRLGFLGGSCFILAYVNSSSSLSAPKDMISKDEGLAASAQDVCLFEYDNVRLNVEVQSALPTSSAVAADESSSKNLIRSLSFFWLDGSGHSLKIRKSQPRKGLGQTQDQLFVDGLRVAFPNSTNAKSVLPGPSSSSIKFLEKKMTAPQQETAYLVNIMDKLLVAVTSKGALPLLQSPSQPVDSLELRIVDVQNVQPYPALEQVGTKVSNPSCKYSVNGHQLFSNF